MSNWYMLTVVGQDRPGIVAGVTSALYRGGCNLGEASMLRLGGNFTIMLMVQYGGGADALAAMLSAVSADLKLHCHVDAIEGALHQRLDPDVRVTVFGADRAGIVARVTTLLADAGMDILDLESDVAGSADKPIYIMHMEGCATRGIKALEAALAPMTAEGIEVRVAPIDTMMG
jgi:glycine cleavage system transcriptional repressor